jgi:hypothetical protein
MKAIGYIIFIPIIILIIGTVYTLLPLGLFSLMSLSKFWLSVLLLFYGGSAIAIFQLLPGVIIWLSSRISPNKRFAFFSVFTVSVIFAIKQISFYWNTPEINENDLGRFFGIMLTCLTIGFAASFSLGAGIEIFERKRAFFEMLLFIGSLIFYLGIFLVFCMITTKVCYISPNKTYSWYSGIWHGIFIIPHWVVSWFSDDIYCKAPNSTLAYSLWWWFSFVFIGMGIFGKNSNR